MLDERWDTDKERRAEYVSLLKNKEWIFMLNERWDTTELSKERRAEYVSLLKIKNEERKIAEYLAQELGVKDSRYIVHIMTKDMKIYKIRSYKELLKSNKISPYDAYVYLDNIQDIEYFSPTYFCPFPSDMDFLPSAYLSKLGFNFPGIAPAPQLKYIAMVIRFTNYNHVIVEVADIGTVATNTNLPKLVRGILGTKRISDSKVEGIISQLRSQKLLAGYNFNEAWEILYRYYEKNDALLAKEAQLIREAYNRIFRPFRLEYDLNTKQFQESDHS